jgi:hypothetical protein
MNETTPTAIVPGDYVRSLDFPGPIVRRDDCYVEGYVAEIRTEDGCPRYVIRVQRRVVEGLEREVAPAWKWVYPPVNGTPHAFGGVCDGVSKVAACQAAPRPLWKTVESGGTK